MVTGVGWPALRRSPLAWLPVLLSIAAIALIVVHVSITGPSVGPSGDEGPVARLFQLLLLLDGLAIVGFVVRWLPSGGRAAAVVAAVQVMAAAVPVVAISLLERLS